MKETQKFDENEKMHKRNCCGALQLGVNLYGDEIMKTLKKLKKILILIGKVHNLLLLLEI